MVLEPLLPVPSDRCREYQFVEELAELVWVHVVTHVRLGALTEYLLVDAKPIPAHSAAAPLAM
jgi:hypothetical protein